ncbi:protein E6 [Brachypodium distachyon]|uniref:OCRE domain-containing protein n=1 Tax=Brachypodium distachyon TaxID=15368 RepID=I1HRN9_BRADI|nr:protein E6 [Brachypodium distachyon]KQK09781.1 hypothetical protein BRADI_2g50133v3 [Brachypodium distachyon]|eukprot:XP_003567123.1 protein E6 [Brachypodium distachyon]
MASSAAPSLFLLAVAFLALPAPRVDAWGGRFFFSKMAPPEAVEADHAPATTVATEAFDPHANSAPAFPSRPSSNSNNRGYGLYGRPEEDEEENYPPAYFRRGVHHDAEKLTTTTNVVPHEKEAAAGRETESSGEGEETSTGPLFPEDGSGRGRPLSYVRARRGGGNKHGRDDYGMSDTRLYENGRYYYDVATDKYGYGYESNPVRTPRPVQDNGSGYGRDPRRSGRYAGDNAAAGSYESRNRDGFGAGGNGMAEKQSNDDGFQRNQNGQYIP